jgi:hypothetical protein
VTYFTSLGYFVLLPDIVYEIGNFFDIRSCNCSYQKRAIGTASIDKSKIDRYLFGGYETDFDITKPICFRLL